jgi:hypothetical protein
MPLENFFNDVHASACELLLALQSLCMDLVTSDGGLLPLELTDQRCATIAHLLDACRQLAALSARVGQ